MKAIPDIVLVRERRAAEPVNLLDSHLPIDDSKEKICSCWIGGKTEKGYKKQGQPIQAIAPDRLHRLV
jgi:hypothetical protein